MLSISAFFKSLLIIVIAAFLAGGLFIYSGLYPIGADTQHHPITYWLLETLREKSIARAAKGIKIPTDLESADRLLAGGADYNDMCTGCHLKPGRTDSDFTIGLYPSPRNLSSSADGSIHSQIAEPTSNEAIRRQFWIIKHGIKASGMPAWGPTHNEERIWNMVAFLQKLPSLSKSEYQILTARGDVNDTHGTSH
ncbi:MULTISPECIES: cytochrome c [Gilvimarinus]|uniref:c-type cytochrome n=1 Tax=Gilvimarinus TaxID=940550 RepID=UPI00035ED01C|nr:MULTISPECIES: cytochrome c [Gilvimarinus]UTF61240.1 cytochrome c [Gilvimarinus sp. DA14]